MNGVTNITFVFAEERLDATFPFESSLGPDEAGRVVAELVDLGLLNLATDGLLNRAKPSPFLRKGFFPAPSACVSSAAIYPKQSCLSLSCCHNCPRPTNDQNNTPTQNNCRAYPFSFLSKLFFQKLLEGFLLARDTFNGSLVIIDWNLSCVCVSLKGQSRNSSLAVKQNDTVLFRRIHVFQGVCLEPI